MLERKYAYHYVLERKFSMDCTAKAQTKAKVDDLNVTWTHMPPPSRFWEVGCGLSEWTAEEHEQICHSVRLQQLSKAIRQAMQDARKTRHNAGTKSSTAP
jgi:hypothetical protein